MPQLPARTARPLLALIVDRDVTTRHLYADYLRSLACVVEEAEDGREALAKAIARQPDIIVTETRLPGLSGIDLCDLLRRDASTRSIPILFVTGDTFQDQLKRAQAVGADAVLVKPCLPEALLAEIHRLLDQSAELRERTEFTRKTEAQDIARSDNVFERSRQNFRRIVLSRTHNRIDTTEPPSAPPALVCPNCDQVLRYQRSHLGGVSARHPEQWDYFDCANGCGTFQYRQRTRKLRKIAS